MANRYSNITYKQYDFFKNELVNNITSFLIFYIYTVLMKVADNLTSIKIWIMLTIFITSTRLLREDMISSSEWQNILLIIILPLATMREVIKIGNMFNDYKEKKLVAENKKNTDDYDENDL
jgi:hypothetical protein